MAFSYWSWALSFGHASPALALDRGLALDRALALALALAVALALSLALAPLRSVEIRSPTPLPDGRNSSLRVTLPPEVFRVALGRLVVGP